jgi:hypothetical protein
MRRRSDDVDVLAIDWARQRRAILGITDLKPEERIGKLRCTLGAIREEREGASQKRTVDESGHYPQNFPEVYRGMSLIIHLAYRTMEPQQREVMHMHYVWREIPLHVRQEYLKLTPAQYFTTLAALKQFIAAREINQEYGEKAIASRA